MRIVFVKKSLCTKVFNRRDPWSHKGDFGKILIIGGNEVFTGSVQLCALAALRSGSDLVTVIAPKRAADICATNPNIITVPLDGDFLSHEHVPLVMDLVERYDAVVIGSGLGLEYSTKKFVNIFVQRCRKPCVVDADGIKLLKGVKRLSQNFVLTPHSKEFQILTGRSILKKRGDVVKKEAKKFNCVILVKGHIDIISDGNRVVYNKTGNPYMTKGGTGDILSGICGSLLGRGVEPFEAACTAAYVCGRAGDLQARTFGEGMLATDILEKIPAVIKSLRGSR